MTKNNSKVKKRPGRISVYDPEYHPGMAFRLCSFGLTDEQLSIAFEVCQDTINQWKLAHVDFALQMKHGKTMADARVAKSLFERACGYESIEIHEIELQAGEGKTELRQVKVKRHLPPDVDACEIWLRNRTNFFKGRGSRKAQKHDTVIVCAE